MFRPSAGRRSFKTFVPLVALLLLAVAGAVGWLVYAATHPPARAYVVTPDSFQQLSERGLRATEEQWTNRDGGIARGWLLRGAQSLPAVVMLHPYGGNRSYFLNLGIKLNEATNFTVLWTDARGHGAVSPAGASSFGAREAADVADALAFLRTLTARSGEPLVGGDVGLYGVEMGAYTALVAARDNPQVRALVVDSVPAAPSDLLRAGVKTHTGIDNGFAHTLANFGARLYFVGSFPGKSACEVAAELDSQRVLLLGGADAGQLQESTRRLERCFRDETPVETLTNLTLTGYRLASAPAIEADAYDRRVIEFFDRTLRDTP